MHRIIFFFSLYFLLIASCSPVRVNLTDQKQEVEWYTAGGNVQQHDFRAVGPQPPLKLIARLKLNAAPGQYLAYMDSTLFIPAKNGRIYTYQLSGWKRGGKLKLPNNAEGNLVLHPDGYLIIGLKLGHETLRCYDLKTAKYIWKKRAGLLWAPPVAADSSVYVVAKFKHVDRYKIRTGERIWRFPIEGQTYASPALSQKLMIFGTDKGKIYALDRTAGKKVWQFKTSESIFASPVVDEEGRSVFVASLDSTLTALALDSGEVLWQYKTSASIRYTPAFAENKVVFTNGIGIIIALDSHSGKTIWTFSGSAPFGTSPLIVGQVLYLGGFDKNLYAFDFNTGQMIWQTTLKGRVRTNPIVWDRYLAVGSEDRYIYLFSEASGEPSE